VNLCDRARKLRPDIVFGADVIAGFPTETEEMFKNTCDLVESCKMTWLHVFPYSARKGTPAARMPQVPSAIRKERANILRSIGDKAAKDHHASLVGQRVSALIENGGIGCTPQFAKVKISCDAPVGCVVDVLCSGAEGDPA